MSEEAVRVQPPTSRRPGATDAGPAARRGGGGGLLPVPTELVVLALTAVALLIAAAVADNFEAPSAWTLVTVLAVGYMLSRGFAKHEHRGDHGHGHGH